MSRTEKQLFALAIAAIFANIAQCWWFWHRLAGAALACGLAP